MKIDAGINGTLDSIAARASDLEEQGYDGLVTAELGNDPFFPMLLLSGSTYSAHDTELPTVPYVRHFVCGGGRVVVGCVRNIAQGILGVGKQIYLP